MVRATLRVAPLLHTFPRCRCLPCPPQVIFSRPTDLLATLSRFNELGQRVLTANVMDALIALFQPADVAGARLRLVRASYLADIARILRRLRPELYD